MKPHCSLYWRGRRVPWWLVRLLQVHIVAEVEDVTTPEDIYMVNRQTGRRRLAAFGMIPLTRYELAPSWRFVIDDSSAATPAAATE